ncbi:MAG: glycosyltransferase family 1 protein [bacterium]
MLIGIDASRANKPEKTGTEWYSYHLIQELKKPDKENRFVLYSREKLRGDLGELTDNFQSKVLKWPFRLWTQLRLSWEMLWSRPDVLFVPAHTMPLIHPKKTIITLHDIGFAKHPELYSKKDLAYHRWATKFALRCAFLILTISEFTKREIVEVYKIKPEKIKVIYLGYDKNQFRPDLEKKKTGRPYFFYIGRLEKKKNILGLIEAFNKLGNPPSAGRRSGKEINLILAGRPGLGFEEIKERIKKYNLQDRVMMPGWLEQEKVPSLMANALALVMPSFYEGFCLPVLEAMAVGAPVIAANSTAIPEIAAGAALLVDPHRPDEIAEAMRKIINNEELRQELIITGLKRAQNFSWEKCARETLAIISGK